MTWTRTTIAVVVVGGAVVLGGGVSTAYALGSSNHSTPVATSTATPTPSKTGAPAAPAAPAKTAAPAAPASQASAPAASAPAASGPTIINNNPPPPSSPVYVPVPAYAPAYVTNNETVVQRYYQFLNNRDFQNAWDLGGSNVSNGVGYDAWVAGYSGTASISLSTWSYYPGSNAVGVTITALQDGGTTNVYQGTYTVINDVIVGADVQQTS
jgi:hypothetical protein